MLKAVSIDEFKVWVEKNAKHTWYLLETGCDFDVKYFDVTLDTRTMVIFRIDARKGGEKPVSVHWGDVTDRATDWTILDMLEHKLGWHDKPPL